jgi:hypothetical protein
VKKQCAAVLIALCAAASLAAQTDTSAVSLLNVENYSKLFRNAGGLLAKKYRGIASDNDYNKVAALSEDTEIVDTPLEIALLSTCSGLVDVRPVEAVNMLPANDPKLVDKKLGAAAYMDMQAARFLGSDPAPHAAALKFITDRGRVAEADIRNFVAQGIAAEVNAEFNKISFMLNINSEMSYNCILTRSVNNQYVLSYESYFGTDIKSKKELSGNSLELLRTALLNNKDFTQSAINTVRTQAALIPAAALAQTGTTDTLMDTVKKALTDFYLNPTRTNYNTVKDIHALFMRRTYEYHQDPLFGIIESSYASALRELSAPLFDKVSSEANQEKYAASTLTQAQIRALTVQR